MQTYDFTNVKDIKAHVASTESSYRGLLDQHKDAGTRYAYDVLFTDKYLTCRDVQLACVRHLQDLLRQGDDNFPYNYDEKFVALIEYFCRLLPNPDDTTQKIKPQHWQSFILDSLIGWRTPNAGVRFNTANISIARRQGKTWLASMLVNFYYFVVCWNATSQDLLVASYDSEHASKLFNDVSLQAKELINQPDFADGAKEKGVDAQTTQVIGKINKNIIRKGTSQGGGFDSFHNAIAVFDEIGNLKPALNETLKQITSGQNGIKNRMFVKISTAYPDIKVKFKHDEDVTRSAIEHDAIRDADTTFQIIYQQDDENEVFEEDTWEKSNPLLAELKGEKRRVLLESLIQDRNDNDREGTLETFVNKSLNIWSRRFKNSYLSLSNINENITSDFNVDNREVYIGFDASQVNDNTSYGFEFPFQENGKHMFFAKQYSFIPFAQAKTLESKSKQDGLDYQQLAQQGFCEITNTPSGTINPDQVYEWLVDYVKRHHLKVRAVCADPNLAKWFIKRISNYQPSWPLIEVAPTSWKLSNPTKDFQSQFLNGDIKILDDPLLIDGLNNAILVEDKGGGIKIDRQNRTSDHIDTTDALINAHYRAQYYYQDFHDEDGYNPMNNMNREERKAYFKSMFGG